MAHRKARRVRKGAWGEGAGERGLEGGTLVGDYAHIGGARKGGEDMHDVDSPQSWP